MWVDIIIQSVEVLNTTEGGGRTKSSFYLSACLLNWDISLWQIVRFLSLHNHKPAPYNNPLIGSVSLENPNIEHNYNRSSSAVRGDLSTSRVIFSDWSLA